MTKAEAEKIFKMDILPNVKEKYERNGRKDVYARCEAWNNFTDSLCKDGKITMKQYETWTHPKCNEK